MVPGLIEDKVALLTIPLGFDGFNAEEGFGDLEKITDSKNPHMLVLNHGCGITQSSGWNPLLPENVWNNNEATGIYLLDELNAHKSLKGSIVIYEIVNLGLQQVGIPFLNWDNNAKSSVQYKDLGEMDPIRRIRINTSGETIKKQETIIEKAKHKYPIVPFTNLTQVTPKRDIKSNLPLGVLAPYIPAEERNQYFIDRVLEVYGLKQISIEKKSNKFVKIDTRDLEGVTELSLRFDNTGLFGMRIYAKLDTSVSAKEFKLTRSGSQMGHEGGTLLYLDNTIAYSSISGCKPLVQGDRLIALMYREDLGNAVKILDRIIKH